MQKQHVREARSTFLKTQLKFKSLVLTVVFPLNTSYSISHSFLFKTEQNRTLPFRCCIHRKYSCPLPWVVSTFTRPGREAPVSSPLRFPEIYSPLSCLLLMSGVSGSQHSERPGGAEQAPVSLGVSCWQAPLDSKAETAQKPDAAALQ